MNRFILALLCVFSLALATSGNYTVEKQVTALHSGNNSGNSSNYTVEFVMPWNPANASGTNYSAVVSVEILGWYFPTFTLPPFNMSLLAAYLTMSKDQQTVTSLYTSMVVPILGGFTLQTIVSIILLLLGILFMLVYVLKYWGQHH